MSILCRLMAYVYRRLYLRAVRRPYQEVNHAKARHYRRQKRIWEVRWFRLRGRDENGRLIWQAQE